MFFCTCCKQYMVEFNGIQSDPYYVCRNSNCLEYNKPINVGTMLNRLNYQIKRLQEVLESTEQTSENRRKNANLFTIL